MAASYWQQVVDSGLAVPADRPLQDLTADLTRMLGDPDPRVRDGLAYSLLAAWLDRGVYDHLLRGLGDGMAAGLVVGLGERGTDSVFRRAQSAAVLARCVARDNRAHLVPQDQVLGWGDRVAAWLLREQDLRAYVPGKGWAHAVARGADALVQLAGSRHLGVPELTVLLDVIADRLLLPLAVPFTAGEPDRLAAATMAVLRRGQVPLPVVEPWLNRLTGPAGASPGRAGDPFLVSGAPQAFLRALHVQVLLSPEPPPERPDLLLAVVDALRASNPEVRSALAPAAEAEPTGG